MSGYRGFCKDWWSLFSWASWWLLGCVRSGLNPLTLCAHFCGSPSPFNTVFRNFKTKWNWQFCWGEGLIKTGAENSTVDLSTIPLTPSSKHFPPVGPNTGKLSAPKQPHKLACPTEMPMERVNPHTRAAAQTARPASLDKGLGHHSFVISWWLQYTNH